MTETTPADTAARAARLARIERLVLARVRRRRWETVDAAIRWATSDSTSPQAAHAIDVSAILQRQVGKSTREITVRPRSSGARSGSLWHAEAAADRARLLAVLAQLDRVEGAVLVWYAHGSSYDAIGQMLRAVGRGRSKTTLMVLHRYGRERVARRLAELGYLDDAD